MKEETSGRVVVKSRNGEVNIAELQRRSAKMLDLIVLGAAAGERTLSATDVEWVARNMWVDGACRPSIHTHWRWNLRCSAKP